MTPTMERDQLLHALARLREQSARRDLALADAAHDLNSPVSVIGSAVKLILDCHLGPLTDEQRQMLLDVQSSCERLRHLISEFITFGAVGSGLQLKLQINDLGAVLAALEKDWSPAFRSKGVRFQTFVATGLTSSCFDLRTIRRVLDSLVDNALKFTPHDGLVSVSAAPNFWERRISSEKCSFGDRRKREDPRPNSVRVVVADTGFGIAPEYHQEIFEEFCSCPADGSQPSSGLGLSIARRVVKAHGGKIWVESEPSTGSRFYVVLPLSPCTGSFEERGIAAQEAVSHTLSNEEQFPQLPFSDTRESQ